MCGHRLQSKKRLPLKLILYTVKTQSRQTSQCEAAMTSDMKRDIPPAYDTPWKIALEQHFEKFMAFYFPAAHAQINWAFAPEFLDKELQAISKDAVVGTRHVDKLVKVRLLSGEEDWICIHVEVQTVRQRHFAERMFVYNYRVFDHYHRPATSMAVLGDDHATWLPNQFGYAQLGCKMDFQFPVVKLAHYAKQAVELESHSNPFALVTLAWLQTRATRGDMNERYALKCKLMRLLLAREWDATLIRQFFLIIDWMMTLPPVLAGKLTTFVTELEEERKMEYVSSIERVLLARERQAGRQEERTEMLLRLLTRRFGALAEKWQTRVQQANMAQIEAWFDRAITAATQDEVFQEASH
jgi:hypothetical protein